MINDSFFLTLNVSFCPSALAKRSSATPIQSPAISSSTSSLRSPASLLSNSQQQVNHTHSENVTPTQSIGLTPSLPIISTSNDVISNSNLSNETIVVQRRTPSAFRPVFKPVRFLNQPIAIKPRVPLVVTRKPFYPPPVQQQSITSSQFYSKQYPTISTSNGIHISYPPTNKVLPNYTGSAQKDLQITSHFNSLVPLNHQEKSKPTPSNFDQLLTNFSPTFSNIKWHTVTSNSIYDIPRLSSKYSSIPLRITLPVAPINNQKLVIKHNPILEKRLLNAGLSPETVALYESILDVAENRQRNFFSPNQYSYQSIL